MQKSKYLFMIKSAEENRKKKFIERKIKTKNDEYTIH